MRYLTVLFAAFLAIGCLQSPAPSPPPEPEPKKESGSILKKTTQEIGKFDPAAGRKVSDSKIRATNPITGPLEAYGPMMEKTAKTGVDYQVSLFYAEHGKWPTYEQFMEQIIKRNNVRLPVLPAKMEYQYDEATHKLVVVHPEEKAEDEKAEEE